MFVNTQKFVRKPLIVDAVRVTSENFDEIVAWCHGEVQTEEFSYAETENPESKKYIRVRVHSPKNARQTKAFVGDWLLYTERGYKVYTNRAFHASFELVDGVAKDAAIQADKTQQAMRGNDVELTPEIDENKVLVPQVSDSPSAPPQPTATGARVLSIAEQREMRPEQVRELVQSGEAVLAQDLV